MFWITVYSTYYTVLFPTLIFCAELWCTAEHFTSLLPVLTVIYFIKLHNVVNSWVPKAKLLLLISLISKASVSGKACGALYLAVFLAKHEDYKDHTMKITSFITQATQWDTESIPWHLYIYILILHSHTTTTYTTQANQWPHIIWYYRGHTMTTYITQATQKPPIFLY